MISHNGKRNSDGSFNWKDALLDASIMAGVSFFSTLGALGVTQLLTGVQGWLAAGIAAGSQFFVVLGMKRGLIEKGEQE